MTIRNKRKSMGLSQSDLADMLDVTQGAISQWENGENSPRADKLPKLAEALKCKVSDLFESLD